MANLFAMRSGDTNSDMEVWQRDYLTVSIMPTDTSQENIQGEKYIYK
jgi:hypothetical protein